MLSQSTSVGSILNTPQQGRARDNHQDLKVGAPYIPDYIYSFSWNKVSQPLRTFYDMFQNLIEI